MHAHFERAHGRIVTAHSSTPRGSRRRALLPAPLLRSPAMVAAPQHGRPGRPSGPRSRRCCATSPASRPRQQHPVGHRPAPRRREPVRANRASSGRSSHDRARPAPPPRLAREPDAAKRDRRRSATSSTRAGSGRRRRRSARASTTRPRARRFEAEHGKIVDDYWSEARAGRGRAVLQARALRGAWQWCAAPQHGQPRGRPPGVLARLLRDVARQSVRASNILCGMTQRIAISNLFALTPGHHGLAGERRSAAPHRTRRPTSATCTTSRTTPARRARARRRSSTSRAC